MRSTLWELRHGLTLLGLLVVFVVVAIRHPIFWAVPVGLTIIAVPILWAREKRSFRRRGYRVVWAGEGRSMYEEAVEIGRAHV